MTTSARSPRAAERLARLASALVCAVLVLLGDYGASRAANPAQVDGPSAMPRPPAVTDPYRVTRWTLADGAPGGIRAIRQTADGFLWLGTVSGLYRFDGSRFEQIEPRTVNPTRSLQVDALLALRNGDLLVGYEHGGLGLYHQGRLDDVPRPAAIDGYTADLSEAPDGSVWAAFEGSKLGWVGHFAHGKWRWFHSGENLPNSPVQSVLAARNGDVYLALYPEIVRMRAGTSRFETIPGQAVFASKLIEDRAGHIWLVDQQSLQRVDDNNAIVTLPSILFENQPRGAAFGRSGDLWIASDRGDILRFRGERADKAGLGTLSVGALPGQDALGRGRALALFEDREGNIWVGRPTGLDRLTRGGPALVTPDVDFTTGFVRAGPTGPIFVGARDGLYRLNPRGAAPTSVFDKGTMIWTLCGDKAGNLLVADADRTFLFPKDGAPKLIVQNNQFTTQSCAADAAGRFWVSKRGLFQVVDGRFVEGPSSLGDLANGRILRPLGQGLVNYHPEGFIASLQGGTARTLLPASGMTTGYIYMVVPTATGFITGAEYGLARYDGRRFATLNARQFPFLTRVKGLALAGDFTWIIGDEGVARVLTRDLDLAFDDPSRGLPYVAFGHEQGIRARTVGNDTNDVAVDGEGKVWLVTNQGLAWIDPQAASAPVAPNVVIQSLAAAGTSYDVSRPDLRLPAGARDLHFEFTALGLTDASANRFRYQLEGWDKDWVEAGNRREAFYTNLPPGSYRFHVIAANGDGVWNREGASVTFSIAPHFYQTWWFVMLVLALAGLFLWLLYRRRLALVTEATRQRIQGQVAERERIARELHDTLLQGVQGLMMRFQAVAYTTPQGSAERVALEEVLERGDDVLLEGRESLRELRSGDIPADLEQRLARIVAENPPAVFEVANGRRPVCAPVTEELARILGEALANVRQHAQATIVRVELTHGGRFLVLTVIDNGLGIDPAVAALGRKEGHYGLKGMQERAESLSAGFSIAAAAGGGTIVRVAVPARVAYRSPWWLFGWRA